MEMISRISGAILIIVALVVGIHTITEPLYYTSTPQSPYSPAWLYIDVLSAVGIVLGVIFAYLRKRRIDGEEDTASGIREYLTANTLFYGFLFAGILFFLSWFNLLSQKYTAIGPDAATVIWVIFDALMPLLSGAMGVHLLRSARRADAAHTAHLSPHLG